MTRDESEIARKVPEIPARRPHGPEAVQHPPLLAPEARAEAGGLWLRAALFRRGHRDQDQGLPALHGPRDAAPAQVRRQGGHLVGGDHPVRGALRQGAVQVGDH